jgi:predicted outer membrane repeat protein
MVHVIAVVQLCLLAALAARAEVLVVAPDGSGDFTTIQAAIDASVTGDEVQVSAGTYFENLDFLGKTLTVRSLAGPDHTILDGSLGPPDRGSCAILHSGETQACSLEGFVLQHGTGSIRPPFGVSVGGAILLQNSSMTIRNCRFAGNSASNGGAIFFSGGNATITDCAFNGNVATTYGGAISGSSGYLNISDCTFAANVAQTGDGAVSLAENASATIAQTSFLGNSARAGAGLNIGQSSAHADLTDCTFAKNRATALHGGGLRVDEGYVILQGCLFRENVAVLDGGGLILLDAAFGLVGNCTFVGNQADRLGGQLALYGSTLHCTQTILAEGVGPAGGIHLSAGAASFTCCDSWHNEGANYHGMADPTGTAGNISLDPLFCHPVAGEFTIDAASPCAPGSPPNPQCGLIGALPIGCQASSVPDPAGTRTSIQSWGRIKTDFR